MIEDEKLLFAEYDRFKELFIINEEFGERRVKFYITLSTAIIAGIITLVTSKSSQLGFAVPYIASAALLGTFLFGFFTFLRMLKRNRVTDEYKGILNYLRKQIIKRSADLNDYKVPFQTKQNRFLGGGLAETVAVMNSLLLTTVVAILYKNCRLEAAISALIVTFGIHKFIEIYKKKSKISPSQKFRAGVGAVIIGPEDKVVAFERRGISKAWQLPQGGLKLGEEPLEAVYREIKEETGIDESKLNLLSQEPLLLAYELPRTYRSAKTGRGQTQYWFQFRFTGTDDDITLGEKKEFINKEWVTMEKLLSKTADFRIPVYRKLEEKYLRPLYKKE